MRDPLTHEYILMILKGYDYSYIVTGQISENCPCLSYLQKELTLRIDLAKPEDISRDESFVCLLHAWSGQNRLEYPPKKLETSHLEVAFLTSSRNVHPWKLSLVETFNYVGRIPVQNPPRGPLIKPVDNCGLGPGRLKDVHSQIACRIH
jgi:hypothetical protein